MQTRLAFRLLILMVMMLLHATAMPAHASDAHEAGIKAFEKENYERALRYFKQAKAEGVRTPNLRYNLGVTYYRLGHYEEAEEAFQLLAENPDWRHLALYSLGLIAQTRGNRQAAVQYYSQVRKAARGSGVAQRAAQKLKELTGEESAPALDRVYSEFSAAAGYDDNAVLAPEDGSQDVSEQGDMFTELYGLTSVYVSGDRNDGVRLDADAFTRLYASEGDYSFSSLSGGISRQKEYGLWHTSLGGSAAIELAESDMFAVVPTAKLKGERSFHAYTLELSNTLNWIVGSSDYEHLTGFQDQLTVRLERDIPGGETYVGIGGEYNDRDDLSEQGEFFSYSPLRGNIHAGFDYALTQRWILALSGQYRKSLYPEENRIEIDGSVTEKEREDERILVSLRGEYDLSRSLIGFVEYSRTDNDSNISRYSYESNRFLVGMRWII